MSELFTAEQAAMETIRSQLKTQIPQIREYIEDAIHRGDTLVYYPFEISLSTKKMLEFGGFKIVNYTFITNQYISWENSYEQICERFSQNIENIQKILEAH